MYENVKRNGYRKFDHRGTLTKITIFVIGKCVKLQEIQICFFKHKTGGVVVGGIIVVKGDGKVLSKLLMKWVFSTISYYVESPPNCLEIKKLISVTTPTLGCIFIQSFCCQQPLLTMFYNSFYII